MKCLGSETETFRVGWIRDSSHVIRTHFLSLSPLYHSSAISPQVIKWPLGPISSYLCSPSGRGLLFLNSFNKVPGIGVPWTDLSIPELIAEVREGKQCVAKKERHSHYQMHYGIRIGQRSECCSVQSHKYLLRAFYATNTVLGTVTQRRGDESPAVRQARAIRTQKCTMTTDHVIANTTMSLM